MAVRGGGSMVQEKRLPICRPWFESGISPTCRDMSVPWVVSGVTWQLQRRNEHKNINKKNPGCLCSFYLQKVKTEKCVFSKKRTNFQRDRYSY